MFFRHAVFARFSLTMYVSSAICQNNVDVLLLVVLRQDGSDPAETMIQNETLPGILNNPISMLHHLQSENAAAGQRARKPGTSTSYTSGSARPDSKSGRVATTVVVPKYLQDFALDGEMGMVSMSRRRLQPQWLDVNPR